MLRDLLNKNAYTVALLGLLVALSYYNALFTPFMWDDKTLVVSNTGLKGGWEGLLAAFSPRLWGLRVDNEAFRSIYRPLHTVLSMIDYRIWGLNPFGFQERNTPSFNTLLVFACALRLGGEDAAFAAAVFAVHPAHTESVTFISGSRSALGVLPPPFIPPLRIPPGAGLRGSAGLRDKGHPLDVPLPPCPPFKGDGRNLPILLSLHMVLREWGGGA